MLLPQISQSLDTYYIFAEYLHAKGLINPRFFDFTPTWSVLIKFSLKNRESNETRPSREIKRREGKGKIGLHCALAGLRSQGEVSRGWVGCTNPQRKPTHTRRRRDFTGISVRTYTGSFMTIRRATHGSPVLSKLGLESIYRVAGKNFACNGAISWIYMHFDCTFGW